MDTGILSRISIMRYRAILQIFLIAQEGVGKILVT